jgi:hypothetical protein
MIHMKQGWRAKEKINVATITTSDDDINLLDDGESLLINDESLSSASMDVNIVFMLPAEFRGVEEEIA